jgi:polyhydroxybutyrate depolymerase
MSRTFPQRRTLMGPPALLAAAVAGLFALAACSSTTKAGTGPSTRPPASTTAAAATPASAGCATTNAATPGVSNHTITSDGVQRVYQLDIPANYNGKKPLSVVFALHPLSVTYAYMPSVMRFATTTEKYDFIGVAPSGRLDGKTPYWYAAPTAENYDIDFISQLLDHLEATMCVDTSHVFSTGISNGAQMSSLLGCRLAGRITAIAPVEGEEYLTPCTGKPEPIMAFHGTADPILPYGGGGLNATHIANIDYWKGNAPPGLPQPLGIDASMSLWARHNGCDPNAVTVRIASDVQERTWKGCKAATILYIVDGGGHGWPGQPVPAFEKTFGPETTSIDATNLLLSFFYGH